MSTLKVSTLQNLSGTEVYTCKAWVNFNGIGTVAIRASGNVSSITDVGQGQYDVNFTTAITDANYAMCVGLSTKGGQTDAYTFTATTGSTTTTYGEHSTTKCRINAYVSSALYDIESVQAAVFR